MSVDPLVEMTGESYIYCGNNPINRIDPTGMNWYSNNDTGQHQWFEGSEERDGFKNLGKFHSYESAGGHLVNLFENSKGEGYWEYNITGSHEVPSPTLWKADLSFMHEIMYDGLVQESSSDTFYIAMNSTGYGGTQNSGPNVRPQDNVEASDLLEWLGISKMNGGFGGKGEGFFSNIIGAGKNLFDVFGGNGSQVSSSIQKKNIDRDTILNVTMRLPKPDNQFYGYNGNRFDWFYNTKDSSISTKVSKVPNLLKQLDSINFKARK